MPASLSVPAAVLGLQAAVNVAFGTYGLVRPADLAVTLTKTFGGNIPQPIAHVSSLQLLNMGALTFFVATRPSLHRRALVARIGIHVMAGYCFWNVTAEDNSTAMTELAFAAMNVFALLFV